MIKDIQELNFPRYASLSHAECNMLDMGDKTITTQVKIDGQITPDFSYDWEVEFKGEKYLMPLRKPQGAKENTSFDSVIDLTFQHWAIYQLKRWYFFTIQPSISGTVVPDKYISSVSLNLKDFCNLFGQVLDYYYGDKISINLNPKWEYKHESTSIEISHSYIWDVLIKFYELFAVRWQIEPNGDLDHYVIKVGYPATEIDHTFEYGFKGGLLKVERQVQSDEIKNLIIGRGGTTNLPKYYFKKSPDESLFRTDPDWVEELADNYFDRLRGATFRSYVQGWKAAHKEKYPGYIPTTLHYTDVPWAWEKGNTDSKFDPVEFVADEIIPLEWVDGKDRQIEIYRDYKAWIRHGSSIDKYGVLLGGIEDNDDIYPTIQGTGKDIVVDFEQITSDEVEESVKNDSVLTTLDQFRKTFRDIEAQKYINIKIQSPYTFTVDAGKHANLTGKTRITRVVFKGKSEEIVTNAELLNDTVRVYPVNGNGSISASGIPEGEYRIEIEATIHNLNLEDKTIDIEVGFESPKLVQSTIGDKQWAGTFNIWIGNVWDTEKGIDEDGIAISETPEQYAERVWKPILGDREGGEAAVVFTTGALAISDDYEFKIPQGAWPVYDTSRVFEEKKEDGSVVRHQSHWRLILAKSDAELETTGLYIPSTKKQGKPGNKFVFIGTEMIHKYTLWAEQRLFRVKEDHLRETKEILPTWVVTTDRVRLNNEGRPNALIDKLKLGAALRLADKRFITTTDDNGTVVPSSAETLYLQSIKLTYREPSESDAALNPDVEIVLSDKYTTNASPVATMQGEIDAIQYQIGSISNIEQIVRVVGDKLYLRKDGLTDRSYSPTEFVSLLSSDNFREGAVGGSGWGFYRDVDGNSVLEIDKAIIRQDMQVNNLVINQITARGGMIIESLASMEVSAVEETDDSYICYFDQKGGTVANLFSLKDIAYCHRYNADNTSLSYYKMIVTEIGEDSITLGKTPYDGEGKPQVGDVIVHYGNVRLKERQYVIIRDVLGGGYERFIAGLSSVNSTGYEYYFAGYQSSSGYRFFLGEKNEHYLEFVNGRLNIKGELSLESSVTMPDGQSTTLGGYINNNRTTAKTEYSRDGAEDTWHSTYEAGDKYMRQSFDNGATWTDPIRISGADGESYSIEPSVPVVQVSTWFDTGKETDETTGEDKEVITNEIIEYDVPGITYKTYKITEGGRELILNAIVKAKVLFTDGTKSDDIEMSKTSSLLLSQFSKPILAVEFYMYMKITTGLFVKTELVAVAVVPFVIAVENYKSLFRNTTQELLSVKEVQKGAQKEMSEIKQTATDISLTVGESGGYGNLLDNTGDALNWGQAWIDKSSVSQGMRWTQMADYDRTASGLVYETLIPTLDSPNMIIDIQDKERSRCIIFFFNSNKTYTGTCIELDASTIGKAFPIPTEVQYIGVFIYSGRYNGIPVPVEDIHRLKPMLEYGTVSHDYADYGQGLKGSGIYLDKHNIILKSELIQILGNLSLSGYIMHPEKYINLKNIDRYTYNYSETVIPLRILDFKKIGSLNIFFTGSNSNVSQLRLPSFFKEYTEDYYNALQFVGNRLTLHNRSQTELGIQTGTNTLALRPGYCVMLDCVLEDMGDGYETCYWKGAGNLMMSLNV